MSLSVRRILDASGLAELAPAWSEIARQSGQTSPFLSHDWFSCCWLAAGPGREPEVLVVEDGPAPVAIAPLVRWKERLRGLPVRWASFLDCPDTPFAEVLSVAQPGPVMDAILAHLATRGDWDMLRLQKLPAASATLKSLETLLSGRFPWHRAGALAAPYLAVEGDWASFYQARSQRFKKTLRSIQNRLDRAGQVRVEEHRAVDPDSALFREMVDLTRRSWKADRRVAIATMPNMPGFFRALTERASAHGWLSLWLLRLDGQPIAMEYQLRAHGKVHALRADYDLGRSDLSPGSALNLFIVRSLFECGGVHEYDMGPGLNEYKLRWASGTHETATLQVYRASLYGRLLHRLETAIVPAARRWRGRAR